MNERVRTRNSHGKLSWHYVSEIPTQATLCEGNPWWEMDDPDAKIEEFTKLSQITCEDCKEQLKKILQIKK